MDDERQEEMDCIAAIFPEILFDPQDPFTATIELPVNPQTQVKVIFPASTDGITPPTPLEPPNGVNVESHNMSYLPSVHLRIALPEGYPAEKPAKFELSTTPSWLSQTQLDKLEANGEQMWEESGRSAVVYQFIDSLQQAAENAFGFAESGNVLEVSQDLKISLLDYDIKACQLAFDKETFDCGICLDPKKGSACHKMTDCGHVFCVQCLQDFYNNAITEGDLVSVRCLAPECAKKRTAAQGKKKAKVQLGPSELLQIPLEHEMVTRYVKLRHKAELESDKNTIYCPRKWCQGAARSTKHRKPNGLEDTESSSDSDSEEEEEEGAKKPEKFLSGKDLLSICEDCTFAFCSRCYQGWHGEFTVCIPQTDTGELTEDDKASLAYLKLHSTPCPTCASRAQKTHGCNHMICFKCNSHFCYLCSSWLDVANPYKHYNQEGTYCYMRLWELQEGDGDAMDRIGDREARERAQRRAAAGEDEIEEEHAVEVVAPPAPVVVEVPQPEVAPLPAIIQPLLQREGPLVLRINQVPPRPIPVAAIPARDRVQQPPRRRNQNPNRQHPPNNNNNPFVRRNPNQNQNQNQPRRNNPNQAQARRQNNEHPEAAFVPDENDAQRRAWVQMFVQMALNDEEDLVEWDEEDEEQGGRWEIPVGR